MRKIIVYLFYLSLILINVSCWHVNSSSNQSRTNTKVSRSTSTLKKHELYFNKGLKVLRKEFVNQGYPTKKIERCISKYKRMFIQAEQIIGATDADLNKLVNIDELIKNKKSIAKEPDFQFMKMNLPLLIDNSDLPDITLINLEESLLQFIIIYLFILTLGVLAE